MRIASRATAPKSARHGLAEVAAYLPTQREVAPRGAVIRDAIRRFVGRRIGAFTFQASDIAGLDINHFVIAFGAGSSAKQIKERLRAASALAKQGGPHPRLPTLHDRDERDLQDLQRGANRLIRRRRKAVVAVAAALQEHVLIWTSLSLLTGPLWFRIRYEGAVNQRWEGNSNDTDQQERR